VRVIGPDNTQLGIMRTEDALSKAENEGLDLVEVSPKAMPPVCRIMDYGKFKYDQAKQTAKAKKHQSTVILKEIKFRPKTDDHDFDFKVKHIRRFLGEGNKAKLVIIFRGREIVHPETGQAMLKAVVEACNDIAVVEQNPMMEGRRMLMVIAPKGGVIARPAMPARPAGAEIVRPASPAPTTAPLTATRSGPTVTTRPPPPTGSAAAAAAPPPAKK
jgi:translation initiation factor IF-3